jgi:hypothetical protein
VPWSSRSWRESLDAALWEPKFNICVYVCHILHRKCSEWTYVGPCQCEALWSFEGIFRGGRAWQQGSDWVARACDPLGFPHSRIKAKPHRSHKSISPTTYPSTRYHPHRAYPRLPPGVSDSLSMNICVSVLLSTTLPQSPFLVSPPVSLASVIFRFSFTFRPCVSHSLFASVCVF